MLYIYQETHIIVFYRQSFEPFCCFKIISIISSNLVTSKCFILIGIFCLVFYSAIIQVIYHHQLFINTSFQNN